MQGKPREVAVSNRVPELCFKQEFLCYEDYNGDYFVEIRSVGEVLAIEEFLYQGD